MKKKLSKTEISLYMSELSKKRKNPYLPFKDSKLAKEMGKRGGTVTARRLRENKDLPEIQDTSQG